MRQLYAGECPPMLVSWGEHLCRCLPLTIQYVKTHCQVLITEQQHHLSSASNPGFASVIIIYLGPSALGRGKILQENATESTKNNFKKRRLILMAETEFPKKKEPSHSKVQFSGVTTLGLQKSLV